jgi:hypothetical protein
VGSFGGAWGCGGGVLVWVGWVLSVGVGARVGCVCVDRWRVWCEGACCGCVVFVGLRVLLVKTGWVGVECGGGWGSLGPDQKVYLICNFEIKRFNFDFEFLINFEHFF